MSQRGIIIKARAVLEQNQAIRLYDGTTFIL